MPIRRLGAASVKVSISDADGFRAVHGDGSVLVDIPADQLQPGDWEAFWGGITAVQNRVAWRAIEAAEAASDAEAAGAAA